MKYKYLHVGIIVLSILLLSSALYLKVTAKYPKPSQQIHKSNLNSRLALLLNKYDPQPISVDKIFSTDHTWINILPDKKITTIVATGDVMLGRSINNHSAESNNFTWQFEYTKQLLNSADITIINLESPFANDCPLTTEGMRFCSDTRNIQGLLLVGVDIADVANNHIGDYGTESTNLTLELLEENNILATGTDSETSIKINGLNFTFLGYNGIPPKQEGINWVEEEKIKSDIIKASTQADVIIVSFHWGVEYQSNPTTQQINLAHLAIDSGADLVIGHHPHWIQPLEIYKNKLIVYSLGNFVFDQMWSQKTREGVIGKFAFHEDEMVDAEIIPIIIDAPGKPTLAQDSNRQRILNEMKTLSKALEDNQL